MARMKLGVVGYEKLDRQIKKMAREFPEAAGRAMAEEATAIFYESQGEVPVDTGRLRDSGRVIRKTGKHGFITRVLIAYSARYATEVHERTELRHRTPTKAKFLEDPLKRALKGMERRIMERISELALKKILRG